MSKVRQGETQLGFRRIALLGLVLAMAAPAARMLAQDSAGQDAAGGRQRGQVGGGQFAGMPRVGGEVTAVSGTTITVKAEDGSTMQIVTTDNTRIMKGRPNDGGGGTVKVTDLKVGDGVMAMGNLDVPNKTLHAAIVMATDAAQLKALKDNLGKTYILGKVTAIDMDNAKMTVERQDGVSQVIGFDETTSFRRGRVNPNMTSGGGFGGSGQRGGNGSLPADANAESITLADVKVGDTVAGRGALKSGTFVPTELTIGTAGSRRARPGGTGGTAPGMRQAPQ